METTRPYHHGNLRQALLDAAVEVIRETGPLAFTLREAARRAGVSHNAPYRHFRDREELLAEVAAQGFQRLTESMVKAASAGTGALERLRRCGRGYLSFALRYPEHFSVMFDRPGGALEHPAARAAGQEAYETLRRFITDCMAESALPSGDIERFALVAWTSVHGVAKLAISGHLPFRRNADILEFCDLATGAAMRGLWDPPTALRP
jgi:AcrR family transcriptional regulator